MFDVEECLSSYFLNIFLNPYLPVLIPSKRFFFVFCVIDSGREAVFLSAYCSGRSGVFQTGEQHYHVSRQDTDFRAQVLYSSSTEPMFVL